MAGLQRATQRQCFCLIICIATILLLLFSHALRRRREEDRHRREILDATEVPAEFIDPSAIDLTPLVNSLINSSQSGSHQLFSLLSVTSYSSLALHKLTLLVYNISSIRSLESSVFRRRFCYCVTNDTNDLTDFTAVLLDVMGNSTSYLHELFKSSSILSVSQRNNSDCIYICVMAGKMGREMPELWEVGAIAPLFNLTIVEGPHRGNISAFRLPIEWHQLPTNLSHVSPSGTSSMLASSRVQSTAHAPHHVFSSVYKGVFSVSPKPMEETAAPAAAQPLAAAQQHTAITTQGQTTVNGLRPTKMGTTQTVLARTSTPQSGTTETLPTRRVTTTSQTQATQTLTTTVLQHTTTGSVTTAPAQSTAHAARQSTASPTPTTFSSAISPTTASHLLTTTTQRTSAVHPSRLALVHPSAGPTVARRTTWPLSRTTTPSRPVATEKPGCPWRRAELTGERVSGSTTTVSAHKLQPCVLELCKFFSQCLCRPLSHRTRMKRYCDDSHLWYEKHTSEVCRRVRRVSFSRNLKQRCLKKMCIKL
ncbi:HERV-H LTR-associating protein 1 Precursor [Channa argus]|uniref:HERV-H LTR-associating protein 1 n=1 Tax=Channa argus TaxID=215402 RepID=A0A6G1Q8Y8_CHAAH|nr:HERV-H LTR-associating protein 1 Precursor [Channa argus]